MDFTRTFNELQKASLFELFRLNVAIAKELRDSRRNYEIQVRLRVGAHVTYFDDQLNQLVCGTVTEINKTRVGIRNTDDGKLWHMPFYMVNLDRTETDIDQTQSKQGLNINAVKVGDYVGFVNSKSGQELYGRVMQRNRKTASVLLENSHQEWRVSYACLFAVIDGKKGVDENVIGSVIIL